MDHTLITSERLLLQVPTLTWDWYRFHLLYSDICELCLSEEDEEDDVEDPHQGTEVAWASVHVEVKPDDFNLHPSALQWHKCQPQGCGEHTVEMMSY